METDCAAPNPLELQFIIRNRHETLNQREAALEALCMKICSALEYTFSDVLWGNAEQS